jgi:DNA-binding NarL/FixJ family response regulator
MPRKDISKEEYDEQQFEFKHNIMAPEDLQMFVDSFSFKYDDYDKKDEKLKELKNKIMLIIKKHIEEDLTKRQKEVIELFLMGKKQEQMGEILKITQEAVWSRLDISLRRLKKICKNDEEILKIMRKIKKI